MSRQRGTLVVPGLLAVSAVMFVASPFLIDAAPYESTMGLIQRIYYYHVPSALVMILSAMVCGIASVRYMATRSPRADAAALSAAELVVVFGLIVLVTGPLWAIKAWGVWWQWDARLTSALVLWLIFVSYLLLRRFAGAGSEMLAAAVGIFGMANVPFVYWSVEVWRTVHPNTNVVRSLGPGMRLPFYWCALAFVCLYVALLLTRLRLEQSRVALEAAYAEIEER
jgi:heme exporter protein C